MGQLTEHGAHFLNLCDRQSIDVTQKRNKRLQSDSYKELPRATVPLKEEV